MKTLAECNPPSAQTASHGANGYGRNKCQDCACEMVFWMEHHDGLGRPHRLEELVRGIGGALRRLSDSWAALVRRLR